MRDRWPYILQNILIWKEKNAFHLLSLCGGIGGLLASSKKIPAKYFGLKKNKRKISQAFPKCMLIKKFKIKISSYTVFKKNKKKLFFLFLDKGTIQKLSWLHLSVILRNFSLIFFRPKYFAGIFLLAAGWPPIPPHKESKWNALFSFQIKIFWSI